MSETLSNLEASNYPRRQLQRDTWLNLNGEWDFLFDDNLQFEHPEQIPHWPLKIKVPFAPESKASGIGDTGFHARCWYRKKFKLPELSQPRLLLHFGAVDFSARVWVNKEYLGSHEGGHSPFTFEIPHVHILAGELELIVQAEDDPFDLAKPRGKQDWLREPHSIWYPRTTGIWQTVWLEQVGSSYIDRLRLTPLLERWEIGCEVFIAGSSPTNLRLRVQMKVGGRLLALDWYEVVHSEVHRQIAFSDPGIDDFRNEWLWSPEKPNLIDVELELWNQDRCLDKVISYTALRSVSIHRNRFLLNGRPYRMRLVLDQGYWPDSLMTPPSSEALKKDVELIKAAGFNGARKHQKAEDPEFLYWADVLGLLVWSEMPSAYRFTHESVERTMREWTEIIDRDISHPCIAVWVPFNESWGVPDIAAKGAHQNCVQAFYHLTKTLDPTRPCIGNDGWESLATDILGIHDYDPDPDSLNKKYQTAGRNLADVLSQYWPGGRALTVEGYVNRGQPIFLSEFGGCTWIDSIEATGAWGYSVCRSAAEFRSRYEGLLAAVHRLNLFDGFCYTQFADTFQEANGLFRADRTPKFSINAMAKATRGEGYNRGEMMAGPKPPPLPAED